jgi:hypothetical protein
VPPLKPMGDLIPGVWVSVCCPKLGARGTRPKGPSLRHNGGIDRDRFSP